MVDFKRPKNESKGIISIIARNPWFTMYYTWYRVYMTDLPNINYGFFLDNDVLYYIDLRINRKGPDVYTCCRQQYLRH